MAPQLPYLLGRPHEAKCIIGYAEVTIPLAMSVLMYFTYTAVMPGSRLAPMNKFVIAGVGLLPHSITAVSTRD